MSYHFVSFCFLHVTCCGFSLLLRIKVLLSFCFSFSSVFPFFVPLVLRKNISIISSFSLMLFCKNKNHFFSWILFPCWFPPNNPTILQIVSRNKWLSLNHFIIQNSNFIYRIKENVLHPTSRIFFKEWMDKLTTAHRLNGAPLKIYPHPKQPLHLRRWLIWEKSGKSSFVNVLLDWCKSKSNWGTNIIVVDFCTSYNYFCTDLMN